MQLTTTLDRTFTDVAGTVEFAFASAAERTPAPADQVVNRIGALNAEAIRQAGRVAVRSAELVESAVAFVGTHAPGLTERVEETTLRLVGRAQVELDGAVATAKTVVAKVDRVVDAVTEEIADEIGDFVEDVKERIEDATDAAAETVTQKVAAAEKEVTAAKKVVTAKTADALESLSKADLLKQAQSLDIAGRSAMTKDQLVAAIRG